jgi:hypothetical protein
VFAGRASMLMALAGVILAAVAAVALFAVSRGH